MCVIPPGCSEYSNGYGPLLLDWSHAERLEDSVIQMDLARVESWSYSATAACHILNMSPCSHGKVSIGLIRLVRQARGEVAVA